MSNLTRRKFLGAAGSAALAGACSSNEPPAAAKPPNLLFLFPDQLRFDWIGATAQIPVRTPFLDQLAARGTRFTQAVCASPLCAPSRACLAAGMDYDRCRVPGNGADYPLDQPTFYQMLRDGGYHVMGCGKFDLHKKTEVWGLDGGRLLPEWGFSAGIDNAGKWDAIRSGTEAPQDPYMGHLHATNRVRIHVDDFEGRRDMASFSNTSPTPLPEDSYCDNWIAAHGLSLLREAPLDRPWFLQVNYTGPHDPLDITQGMEPLYRGLEDFPQPNGNTQFPAAQHLLMRQNYSAMIENIDRWTGKFLEEVEKRGELENTIVVFSSDHGEMLGDHNRWKKQVPYQPSVGVPLVVAGPSVKGAVVSEALVSVMDLAATFLDYAGQTAPAEMDSRSMRPLLSGQTRSHREHLRSGLDPWRAVFDGRYKLVRGFDESVDGYYSGNKTPAFDAMQQHALLFDLLEDPGENVNLAERAADIVDRLTPLLRV